MPELVSVVFVHDEVGVSHRFEPGDAVPDWAVARISNPKAWSDGVVPVSAVVVESGKHRPVEAEPAPASAAEVAAEVVEKVVRPARRGRPRKSADVDA